MSVWDDWFVKSAQLTAPARELLTACATDDEALVADLQAHYRDLPGKLALLWEPYLAYLRACGIDEAEHWQRFCAWMSETEAAIAVGDHPFGDDR